MVKLVFKNNSEIKMTDVRSLLKNNKIKSFLINKQTLHLLETDIDQLKDILFNNISSSEIIEIISMEMGKKIKLQLEEKNKYVNTGGLNGSGGSNCGGDDNQSDPYVRKSDLTVALSNFVTKSELKHELNELRIELKNDLKEEIKDFVTRSELRHELNQLETNLRKDMVTKADLKEELKNFVTKDELNELRGEMNSGFAHLEKLILANKN
jgi:hypothetical protein